jgi:protein farnesyltransferase subunit beta
MKDTSGAFRMHDGGEIDVRASYTAISVASLVNILDGELAKGVGNYITRCQTYEGGIAGEPYAEAHGGYVSTEDLCFFLFFLYVSIWIF